MIKKILISILIMSLCIVTGCWDSRPVDELGIISNITIEKINSNEKIKMNIIRPTFEKDKKELVHRTTVEASTIIEAIDELQKRGSKLYVLGQVNNVLLGKNLASSGIGNILSQLDHITDFESHALLAVLNSTFEDFEKFKSPQQEREGLLLLDTIQASIKKQQIPETSFYHIMSIIVLEGREIVLPIISMNPSDNNIIVEGLGIFKGDKMVGKVGIFEGIPYMIITSPKINELVLNIPSEETEQYGIDNLSVVIRKKKVKIETSIEKGIPIIQTDITLIIDEESFSPINATKVELGRTFMDKETLIKSIENSVATHLEKETKNLIELTQKEFESDIFGFGEKIRVKNNEYFKSINWEEVYPLANITCNYKVTLRKLGTVK